jgi:hypothetical protein
MVWRLWLLGTPLSNAARVASTRSEGDWEMRTDVGRDQQKLCQISVSPHQKTPLVAEPLAEILLRRGGTAGEGYLQSPLSLIY